VQPLRGAPLGGGAILDNRNVTVSLLRFNGPMFHGAWRNEDLDYVWNEEGGPLPLLIPGALTPDRARFGLTSEGAGIESDRLGVCVLSLSMCLCVSDCLYVCMFHSLIRYRIRSRLLPQTLLGSFCSHMLLHSPPHTLPHTFAYAAAY
jgi:hypothetical protein